MTKEKRENYFWTSYSDLMTSMFFVMLVLFIFTIALLSKTIWQLQNTVEVQEDYIEKLERINKIDEQFEPLKKSGKFIFYPKSKKFVAVDLIGHEIFDPNETIILDSFVEPTLEVGFELEYFLKQLSIENSNFSYQLVIEGNMANTYDKKIDIDNNWGYRTSYERALAVYNLWNDNGIDLRKYNTEILICGSGFNGKDRDGIEENNKRFSIQIIPKINPDLGELNK